MAGCLLLFAVMIVLAAHTVSVQAATTGTLNFQARLMTANGGIVPDGYYNVEFKLYSSAASSGSSQGSCSGDANCLWAETYYDSNGVSAGNDSRVQVRNGYLTVNLGSLSAFPTTINWDQDLWITMNVGGTTQTATPTYDGEMNPRLKLTAVPYAFKAGQLAQYNSVSGYTSTLSLQNPTGGNQFFRIPDQGAAGTYDLLTGSAANGSFIKNTTVQQTAANFNIDGSGTVGGTMNVGTISSGNLLSNPSFETNTATWSTNSSTLARVTTSFYSGSASLEVTATGTTNVGTNQTIATGIVAGNTYSFSAYAKAGSITGSPTITARIGWKDGSGTELSESAGSTSTISNSWQRFSVSGTAPAGTVSAVLRLYASGATTGDKYLLDAIQLENGGSVTPYTDTTRGTGSLTASGNLAVQGTVKTNGSLNLTATNAASVGVVINGVDSQSADLLQFKDATGTVKSGFGPVGQLYLGAPSNGGGSRLYVTTPTGSNILQVNRGNGGGQTGDLMQYQSGNGEILSRVDANGQQISYGTGQQILGLSVPAFTTSSTGAVYYYVITATNIASETVASTSLGMANNTSTLAWNQINGATGYKIYRNTSNAFTTGSLLLTTTTNGTTVSFTDTGVATAAGLPPTTVTGNKLIVQGWNGQAGNNIFQVLTSAGANVLRADANANVAIGNGLTVQGSMTSGFTNGKGALVVKTASGGSSTDRGLVVQANTGQTANQVELQDASGNTLSGFDANSVLFLGRASGVDGSLKIYNATNNNVISLQTAATASSYTLTLPTAVSGTANQCLIDTTGAGVLGFAACPAGSTANSFIANGTGTQVGANFNIGGNGIIGGNFSQTGSGTFSTGSGTVSLNGNVVTSGSLLNTALALSDFASGGSIGIAATTVDIKTAIAIAQTTTGQSLTIPNPTTATAGRVLYILNTGSAAFNLLGSPLMPAVSATLVWNGTAWTFSGADANSILNQNASTQTANFKISGTGALGQLSVNGVGTNTITGGTNIIQSGIDNGFMLQSSAGEPFLTASTTAKNLIGWSPTFEANGFGWNILGGATVGQYGTSLTNVYGGRFSLRIVTASGTANSGANSGTFTASLTSATTYTFSFYAKSAANLTTLRAGMAYNGSTETPCTLNSISVSSSGFQRYSCTFTTGTISGSPYVFITTSDTVQNTIYIDDVQLIAGSSTQPVGVGALNLMGVVSSPLTIMNNSDSTSAFQIQNSAGTSNLFVADTLNGRITITAGSATVPALRIMNADSTAALEIRTGGSGQNNSFVGLNAGAALTSGSSNSALGANALQTLTTGSDNTAVGYLALNADSTGSANVAIGANALKVNTGSNNVAVGTQAGLSNTTGTNNTAVGTGALAFNTGGGSNTALGSGALLNNLNGFNNTAVGLGAMASNTSGNANIGIGLNALSKNTSGAANTAIGNSAGTSDSDSFNTLATLNNTTILGTAAQSLASNTVILGGAGGDQRNVGIGTPSPSNVLSVSPVQYGAGGPAGSGTTASQSGTTVTGVGTTFTGAMIGSEIVWKDGSKATISAVGSTTSLTVTPSQTVASQIYRIHYAALQVTSGGNVGVGTTTPGYRLDVQGGDINTSGSLYTGGTVRLDSAGALNNITGYNQTSGNFTVFSGPSRIDTSLLTLGALTGGRVTLSTSNVQSFVNLITSNPGFETFTTGWTVKGSGTGLNINHYGTPGYSDASATAPNVYDGNYAMVVTTASGTANTGAKYQTFSPAVAGSTTYTLSFYAKASGSGFSTLQAGMAYNGSTDTPCTLNSTIVSASSYGRYSCTFTTSASVSTPYIFVGVSDTTTHSFYIDDVQLQAGGSVTPFSQGYLKLQGVITNPVSFQSASDSTTAFQIQNSAGTSNLFNADTLNNRIDTNGFFQANNNARVVGWINATNVFSSGYERGDGNGTRIDILANSAAQFTSRDNTDQILQIVKGAATQTSDLMQFQNSSSSNLLRFTANGGIVQSGTAGFTSGTGTISLNGDVTIATGKTLTVSTVIVGDAVNGITLNGSGVTLLGTYRTAKSITLTAQYAGAVLDPGAGSNNTGTMTNGIDLANRQNYYKWTTNQGTNQSYDVDIQVPIPTDFSAWTSATPVAISAYTSDTANGLIKLEARDTGGSIETNCNFVSVTPGSTGTWATDSSSCTLAGTYTAGGYMTLRVRLQSPTSGDVRVGNIVLVYKSNR